MYDMSYPLLLQTWRHGGKPQHIAVILRNKAAMIANLVSIFTGDVTTAVFPVCIQ
jgi:hypothetical protein